MTHKFKVGDKVVWTVCSELNEIKTGGVIVYIDRFNKVAVVDYGDMIINHRLIHQELTLESKAFEKGFVNVFRVESGIDVGAFFVSQHIYRNEEMAVADGKLVGNYVDTVEVEWKS